MSPISSRNSVPPSASSTLPGVVLTAPVNAPFSFLAGARFAQQQRRHVGGRDFFDHSADCQHALARRDDAVQWRVAHHILQPAVFGFKVTDAERALDDQLQGIGVDGLLVEVVGTLTDGRKSIMLVTMPCHHDHFRMGRQLQNFAQCEQPFIDAIGFRRQTKILQNDSRLVASEFRDRRLAITGRTHVVVFETPAQLAE
jgi:hypothetical protein